MPEQKHDQQQITNAVRYDPISFHNSEELYFIYKKIEAVAGAVFLITQSVSDSEIIKKNLRDQVLVTLSKVVQVIGLPKISVIDLQPVSSNLSYISSLLDIGFWSGVLSQMNVSLIQKEVGLVFKKTNDLIATYQNNFFIDQTFFDKVQSETTVVTSTTPISEHTQKTVQPVQTSAQVNTPEINIKDIKGQNIKDKQMVAPRNTRSAPSDSGFTVSQGSRRQAILKYLREHSGVAIKDIVSVVPGVSEKTIQRELISLVDEGVIKKEGERRWSTYSAI